MHTQHVLVAINTLCSASKSATTVTDMTAKEADAGQKSHNINKWSIQTRDYKFSTQLSKLASNSVTQASATVDPLAAVSLSVFPALGSVIAEAASVSARPLILTHMSKATPVTLITSL